MTNTTHEIEQAMQTYLDGFHHGDVARLAAVFHPSSALTQSTDEGLYILSREAWLAMVAARPSPAALGLARADQILAINVVGPNIAHVKLRCAIPPRYFTDLLSLLKVEGRWQVVQKVYMTEIKP